MNGLAEDQVVPQPTKWVQLGNPSRNHPILLGIQACIILSRGCSQGYQSLAFLVHCLLTRHVVSAWESASRKVSLEVVPKHGSQIRFKWTQPHSTNSWTTPQFIFFIINTQDKEFASSPFIVHCKTCLFHLHGTMYSSSWEHRPFSWANLPDLGIKSICLISRNNFVGLSSKK